MKADMLELMGWSIVLAGKQRGMQDHGALRLEVGCAVTDR